MFSDRWNSGAGEMGVLLDVAYNKENWAFPVQWVDRPDRLFSVSPDGTAARLDDKDPIAPLKQGDRLGYLPHIGGIYNAGDRERGSMHGAFQWKISPKLELTTQYLGTGYRGRSEVDYILAIVGWTPRLANVVLPQAGSAACKTKQETVCPILAASTPAARWGGQYDYDPYFATSTWGVKEKTDTHYVNAALQYRDGPLDVVSSAAFTQSEFVNDTLIVDQQIPNVSMSVYTYGADGHGGYNSLATPSSSNPLRDPRAFVLRGMVQNWGESKGKQAQWRTDFTYRLNSGFFTGLTGGLRLSSRNAVFHGAEGHADIKGNTRPNPVDLFGPSFEKMVPGLERLGGPWLTPSRDYLIGQADKVRAGYGVAAGRVAEDPNRLFDQRERTTTVHLGARFQAELGGVEVTGSAGARVVRVQRQLRGKSRVGEVVSDVDLSTSENNVLPNLSAVVSWTEKLQSHLSVGKTITRPEFASLNPALSLIPPTVNAPGSGSAGNPNLQPTKSINTDATLEYYFDKNGFAQIALFHRDIDGYLQNFEQEEVIGGLRYRVNRPQNSGKGTLRGAEFGIQKFFDFLPAPFNDFGAQFNYTLIDGENQTRTSLASSAFNTTPLVGVAKNSYNLALLYEGHGITGRLAATRRGSYTEQIAEPRFGQNRVVAASTYVDLSLAYQLTPKMSVHFDAVNLTKEKYESYLEDPMRPRDIRYTPTTYGLSLRFKL
jgi:TonB-dependent receptor